MKILLSAIAIVALLTQPFGFGGAAMSGINSLLTLYPNDLSSIAFNLTGSVSRASGGYVVPLQTLRLNEEKRLEVAYSEGATLDGGEAISAHGPLVPLSYDVIIYGTDRGDMIANAEDLMIAITNQTGGTLRYKPEDAARSCYFHYVQSAPPKLKSGQRWDAPPNAAGMYPIQVEVVLQTLPFCTSDPDNPVVALGATTVYNQDNGVVGYAAISSSSVIGTIGALTQLRIRYTTASAAIKKLFYFRRSRATLSNFDPILEGGTPDTDSEIWWSTISDSTRRSNNYQRYAPAQAANNLWAYLEYTISNPTDHEGKAAVALICRSMTEEVATWDLKATIEVADVEMETEVVNPERTGAWHIVILGELDIPPTPISADESYSPKLKVYLRRTTGDTSQMIDVDFVTLIYVDEYPQRVLVPGGFTDDSRLFMENFNEELCHIVHQGTLAFQKTAEPVAAFLQLKPQADQRLYFLWERLYESILDDDFEDYEAWRWVKVADFETDESWSGSGDSADTTYYVEGSQGRQLTESGPAGSAYSRIIYDTEQDFTGEGRFTDDDYVYFALYLTTVSGSFVVSIKFETDRVARDYYYEQWSNGTLSSGWNFMKVKKSDMNVQGSPDWSSIESIAIGLDVASGTPYATFDDWRIVRADPDDASKGNDTGAVWDFMRDVWHIEELDSADHAIGCIDTTGALEQVALIHEEPLPNFKYLAKVRAKRDDGDVGLVFRCEDGTSGSEDTAAFFVDTANDQLELRKWAAGSAADIATAVSQTTAPDTDYYLGVQMIEDMVRCYFGTSLAAIWNSDNEEFVESAKVFEETDSDFASGGALEGGQCGVLSVGTLGRFNDVKLHVLGEHVPGDTVEIYMPVLFRSFAPFGE